LGCHVSTMATADIRWHQRFENLQRALGQLEAAIAAHAEAPGNELIGMALIKAYEFSFELSWKTLKDLLHYNGIDADLPREVIKQAFGYELIEEGQTWIDMLEQRYLMAHTYDQSRAERAIELVVDRFWPALRRLRDHLERRLEQEQRDARSSS
jgi:nucleotidyltransferase substrate binding protein (TIGR01987 family)